LPATTDHGDIEFSDAGRGDELHENPDVGRLFPGGQIAGPMGPNPHKMPGYPPIKRDNTPINGHNPLKLSD
jgi:hypothetical protein